MFIVIAFIMSARAAWHGLALLVVLKWYVLRRARRRAIAASRAGEARMAYAISVLCVVQQSQRFLR